MIRTIVSVAGNANYTTSTGYSNTTDLDTKEAIIYITPSGIRYGIIINAYRKNDSVTYDKAQLVNDGTNPITVTYVDGYATIKGKIQLINGQANVGDLLDFTKTFAVENDVSRKFIVVDSQNSTVSSIGSSYKKITIYATVHF